MKRAVIKFITFTLAAVACTEGPFISEPTPGDDVVFRASLNKTQTKTLYGAQNENGTAIKVNWVNGDKILVYGDECDRKQAEYTIVASKTPVPNVDGQETADDIVKSSDVGVQWGGNPSQFYAIYPSHVAEDFTPITDGVKVRTKISPTQYNTFVKSQSSDENDKVWYGVPYDFSDKSMRMNDAIMYACTKSIGGGNAVDLQFKPFTTVLKFRLQSWTATGSLSGAAVGKSIHVKSITLSASYPIAGEFDFIIPNDAWGTGSPRVIWDSNENYTTSQTITITPAEQLNWAFGEALEFSIFTIPVNGRSLSSGSWSIVLDTSDGLKRFNLKPNSENNCDFKAGQIHKLNIPGFPVQTPWEPKNETWVESIDRNIYLSELSLPGAWYATDAKYQGEDIGLGEDELTYIGSIEQNGSNNIDDGLEALYASGIRAFNIDCRLTLSEDYSVRDAYKTHSNLGLLETIATTQECREYTDYLPHATDGVLVLTCAGTEEGALGDVSSIGKTVEDAIEELIMILVQNNVSEEFIEIILSVSQVPFTEQTGYQYVRGTVNPQMMAIAICNMVNRMYVKYPTRIYDGPLTPATTIGDVLGKVIIKFNANTNIENIINYNQDSNYGDLVAPMIVSEASMATSETTEKYDYASEDILIGTFNEDVSVPMYWSNSYVNQGYSPMYFHFHQCQNTSAVTIDDRESAIWKIISNAKQNYNIDAHNTLYQIGIGGWTEDTDKGKYYLASQLTPFVNTIIESMLNEETFEFRGVKYPMSPTPVGAVLMNFALKDEYKFTEDFTQKTYTLNSSTLINNIIKLNSRCPMSRDENKPAWPGEQQPDYVEDIFIDVRDWENIYLN